MRTITQVFTFVVSFWLTLFIFFGVFGGYYDVNSITTSENADALGNINENTVDDVSGFSFFSNMTIVFKIMFWSVPDNVEIPGWVSMILDLIALLSLFVVIMWARGVS